MIPKNPEIARALVHLLDVIEQLLPGAQFVIEDRLWKAQPTPRLWVELAPSNYRVFVCFWTTAGRDVTSNNSISWDDVVVGAQRTEQWLRDSITKALTEGWDTLWA